MRIRYNPGKTFLPKAVAEDPGLSAKAKGIYCTLATLAVEANVTIKELVDMAPDGRVSVQSGLEELKQKGYMSEISPGFYELEVIPRDI